MNFVKNTVNVVSICFGWMCVCFCAQKQKRPQQRKLNTEDERERRKKTVPTGREKCGCWHYYQKVIDFDGIHDAIMDTNKTHKIIRMKENGTRKAFCLVRNRYKYTYSRIYNSETMRTHYIFIEEKSSIAHTATRQCTVPLLPRKKERKERCAWKARGHMNNAMQ